jgi:hypothetical protein
MMEPGENAIRKNISWVVFFTIRNLKSNFSSFHLKNLNHLTVVRAYWSWCYDCIFICKIISCFSMDLC